MQRSRRKSAGKSRSSRHGWSRWPPASPLRAKKGIVSQESGTRDRLRGGVQAGIPRKPSRWLHLATQEPRRGGRARAVLPSSAAERLAPQLQWQSPPPPSRPRSKALAASTQASGRLGWAEGAEAPRPRFCGGPGGAFPRDARAGRVKVVQARLHLPAAPPPLPPGRSRRMALGGPLRALLLLLEALLPPGVSAEPAEATIDGRALSVSSLQEAESRAFTCLASAPSLAWYLNGERQETNGSSRLLATADGAALEDSSSSTFVVTARRLDRQLNCSATDPATGQVSSASVLLNVQFKPEIVKMDTWYEEGREPGLFLVLFVLVQANPPATIIWVDQDGHVMVNTSTFLILDTKTYPWLTNHTVQVQLSSLSHNFSFSAANDVGIANASVLVPGFLDTRIELSLLALVVGAAVALGTLLGLGALISCVVYRKGKKAAGLSLPAQLPPSDSNNLKPMVARLPRANVSLPANLQLNDLTPEPKAKARAAEQEEPAALSEPEESLALSHTGAGQFPMVGYIYRASSMSSDEIWL